MSETLSFVELMGRVRRGDQQAIGELVLRYEPVIRVAIRVRLNNSGLRRLFDSTDISQSILGNFFARAALGQFDVEQPEQLVKLLVTMARNRLTNHILQQQAARRDHRRDRHTRGTDMIDPGPSPSEVISGRDLLQTFLSRLSPEERRLAEQRAQGKDWTEIATSGTGTPDGLRMRLGRAVDRVAQELEIDG